MSSNVLTLFFAGVLLLTFVSVGNSIECWYCNTQQNDNCTSPSSTNGIRIEKCKAPVQNRDAKMVCRTVEFEVTREKRLHVSRSCYEEKDRSGYEACSKTLLVAFPKVKKCDICTTDRCNGKAVIIP